MLRIVSKCSTQDEFVAVFQRFCDSESIFVATKTPKGIGHKARFAITLADGETMLAGLGVVVESHEGRANDFNRPGMRLRFVELEEGTTPMAKRLGNASNNNGRTEQHTPPPLPKHLRPVPPAGTVPPRSSDVSGPIAVVAASVVAVEDAGPLQLDQTVPELGVVIRNAQAEGAPTNGQRAPGSDYILPANPFGELSDQSLEAFVECTLYEETGNHDLDQVRREADIGGGDALEEGTGDDGVPAWWPRELASNPTPVPAMSDVVPANPFATSMMPAEPMTIPAALLASEAQVAASNLLVPAAAASQPLVVAPMRVYMPEPTEIVTTVDDQRRSHRNIIIAAVAGGLLSLIISYAIWGGGSSEPTSESESEADRAVAAEAETTGDEQESKLIAETPAKGDTPTTDPAATVAIDAGVVAAVVADSDSDSDGEADGEADGEVDGDSDGEADEDEADEDEPTDPFVAAAADGTALTDMTTGDCKLSVFSTPKSGTVTLDGKRIGETPLKEVSVPCGEAKVIISSKRYEDVERTVTLVAGEVETVKGNLVRPSYMLRVTSSPSGASITVDGRSSGKTPASIRVKGYQFVTVSVAKSGYTTYTKKIYPKTQTTSVRTTLRKKPKKPRKPKK